MKKLVIISGVSGSGKSTCLGALEDAGYFCIVNVPPSLLDDLTRFIRNSRVDKVGLVVDARSIIVENKWGIPQTFEGLDTFTIFLDCDTEEIMKRYQYTRRKHPLQYGVSMADAIKKERELLKPIKDMADMVIDTTHMEPRKLRARILEIIGRISKQKFSIFMESFAYRNGIPVDMDFVLDVRFLPNPFYIPNLKNIPGNHPEVKNYLKNHPEVMEYLEKLEDLLLFAAKKYVDQGRFEMSIAVGCTGGFHRSVFVVEELAERFRSQGYEVVVNHRDMEG